MMAQRMALTVRPAASEARVTYRKPATVGALCPEVVIHDSTVSEKWLIPHSVTNPGNTYLRKNLARRFVPAGSQLYFKYDPANS